MLMESKESPRAYVPVYVPFTDIREKASSLPHEEAMVEEWVSRGGSWQTLSRNCEETYGLQLLLSEELFSTPKEKISKVPSLGMDALRIEGEPERFLFTDPREFPMLEKKLPPQAVPYLVRPSLFHQLLAKIESGHQPLYSGLAFSSDSTNRNIFARQIERLSLREPSDWHCEPQRGGFRSRLRIHGQLVHFEDLSREVGWRLILSAANACDLQTDCFDQPADGECALPELALKVRLSWVPSAHGPSLVARFLPLQTDHLSMENLGFDPATIQSWLNGIRGEAGLSLCVGKTGSGKSTTIAASLIHLSQSGLKCLSVEDPVENRLQGIYQVAVDHRRGVEFSTCIRAFLRQSPDLMVVGEIRDRATAEAVREATLSGHRVLASFHAGSPSACALRLQELGFPLELQTHLLRQLLFQDLFPIACENCHRQPDPSRPVRHSCPQGCAECNFRGTIGRRALYNLCQPAPSDSTPPLREAVRSAIETGCICGRLSRPPVDESFGFSDLNRF